MAHTSTGCFAPTALQQRGVSQPSGPGGKEVVISEKEEVGVDGS